MSLKRNMELTCDGCGVKENVSRMGLMESGRTLGDLSLIHI